MKLNHGMTVVAANGADYTDLVNGVSSYARWLVKDKNWERTAGNGEPEDSVILSEIHTHGSVNVQHFRVANSGRTLALWITPFTGGQPIIYSKMAWRRFGDGTAEIGLEEDLFARFGVFV